MKLSRKLFEIWSGRWESNPRPKLRKLLKILVAPSNSASNSVQFQGFCDVALKKMLGAVADAEDSSSREKYATAKSEFIECIVRMALAEGYPREL
jgi:hypothetical protein